MVMRFDGSMSKADDLQQWEHVDSSMLTERMGIVTAFSSFTEFTEYGILLSLKLFSLLL